jgi:transposase
MNQKPHHRKLTDAEKRVIVASFQQGTDINTLAHFYGRHRTTIVRALEDAGIDPGIHRRPNRTLKAQIRREAERLLQEQQFQRAALEPISRPIQIQLDEIPVVNQEPWYRRVTSSLKQIFRG